MEWIWKKIKAIYGWFDFWINLIVEIFRRLLEPLRYPTYNIYFIVVIVFVGGLGFWIPYFQEPTKKLPLAQQLSTYLLAITAASFADICFSFFTSLKRDRDEDDKLVLSLIDTVDSTMMSLWSFAFMVTIAAVTLGIYSLLGTSENAERAYTVAIIGTVLSLFLWLMANYDNRKLKETSMTPDPLKLAMGEGTGLSGEGVNEDGTIDLG